MSLAVVYSRALEGIQSPLVTVEVHISNGLPGLSIVGLPETAVKESKDRVRSAIINSQFKFPPKRITVNLAPADLPKEGGRFDLAIAMGILIASEQIGHDGIQHYEFIGELALSGALRPIKGILPSVIQTKLANRILMTSISNAAEAAMVKDVTLLGADHLLKVCAHLQQHELIPEVIVNHDVQPCDSKNLAEVYGQHHAKRALEIAAAGGHNLLMIGPPGTGKSMLASRLSGIMPILTDDEAIEVAALQSISGKPVHADQWKIRPFRSPHHTASAVAMVGGGSHPKPGEISLSHCGVLFLDELPEYDRKVLEVLREPLETGMITISRAARHIDFPARFQLISAMNPCPCGYLGDSTNRCQCTADQVRKYRGKISGPLLDRIDLHVEVSRIAQSEIRKKSGVNTETSSQVRFRVEAAVTCQRDRCGSVNSQLSNKQIEQYCQLNEADANLLDHAMEKLNLSTRAYHRILKVARTIADLDKQNEIQQKHLTEALSFRKMDRYLV